MVHALCRACNEDDNGAPLLDVHLALVTRTVTGNCEPDSDDYGGGDCSFDSESERGDGPKHRVMDDFYKDEFMFTLHTRTYL